MPMLVRGCLALLLLLQAASYGPVPPAAGAPDAEHCPEGVGDEIVVCKHTTDQTSYRYKPLEPYDGASPGIHGPGGSTVKGSAFRNAQGTAAAGIKLAIPF